MMIAMVKLDPHFAAAFYACETACQILELLPRSDLIDDMRDLIHTQHSLFLNMIEGKHYGTDALNAFVTHTFAIREEAKRLKEEKD